MKNKILQDFEKNLEKVKFGYSNGKISKPKALNSLDSLLKSDIYKLPCGEKRRMKSRLVNIKSIIKNN